MELGLDGKVVLVTGGSQGIGLAAAQIFAAEGAEVVIAARRPDALAQAADSVRSATGRRVGTVSADVTVVADLDAVAATMRERYGRVDVLVNNAGTGTYKPFLEVTEDELRYAMDINYFAQFRLCQRIVPLMPPGSAIVNVSGRTALQTLHPPGSTASGPAKAAELRFTADLAIELLDRNIRVNCIVPGVVASPERFEKWEREAGKAAAAVREKLDPSGKGGARWGTPEEIGEMIVFTASARGRYLNGESILMDGATKVSYRRLLAEVQEGR